MRAASDKAGKLSRTTTAKGLVRHFKGPELYIETDGELLKGFHQTSESCLLGKKIKKKTLFKRHTYYPPIQSFKE